MRTISIRNRILAAGIGAALLAGVGAAGAATAAHADPAPAPPGAAEAAETTSAVEASGAAAEPGGPAIDRTPTLGIDQATTAARRAIRAAEKEDQNVSVAVVDRAGNTRVLLKGDGAGPQSAESAERKAYTAVAWNAPTSELADRVDDSNRLNDIPGTLFLAGGIPLSVDDTPVVGIGVAGAPSGDLDESFAQAGLRAIQADPD